MGGEGRGRFETAQFLEGWFSRADRGQRTGKGCCWLLGSKTRRPSLTRGKGLGCGVWCSAAAPPPRRAIDSSMSVILGTWMRFLRTFTCHAQRAPLDQPEVARGGGGAPGVRARNFFAPRGGRCWEGTVAGSTHRIDAAASTASCERSRARPSRDVRRELLFFFSWTCALRGAMRHDFPDFDGPASASSIASTSDGWRGGEPGPRAVQHGNSIDRSSR